jgi:hypothetical protein
MDGASSFDDYRMPDELWELLEPFLPKYPASTYAHAQVHPGGMTAAGIGMGRWESWTTS